MPTNTFTVTQTATQLDVSPATVRRYAAEFAADLSADATPPPGAIRRFTPEDVQVMRIARNQLALGETYETVRAILATVTLEPLPNLQEPPGAPIVSASTFDPLPIVAALQSTLDGLTSTMDGLTSRVDGLADAVNRGIDQAVELERRRAAAQFRAERLQLALLIVLAVAVVVVAVFVAMIR